MSFLVIEELRVANGVKVHEAHSSLFEPLLLGLMLVKSGLNATVLGYAEKGKSDGHVWYQPHIRHF